jgi:hypothetical protein
MLVWGRRQVNEWKSRRAKIAGYDLQLRENRWLAPRLIKMGLDKQGMGIRTQNTFT